MKKTDRVNSLTQRYSACDDAVALLRMMLETIKLLKKAIKRVYPDEVARSELAETCTAIKYDCESMKNELSDLALELAEELKEVQEGRHEERA